MTKARINISTDQDLADFIKIYAAENRTTVTDILTQYILYLKRNAESEQVKEVLSNPIFHKSMDEAHTRLKNGSAVWHSYDDVFGD